MTNPPLTEKTVAFFVALGDEAVSKDWSELTKASLVVIPTVAKLAITKSKGGSKKTAIRSLIAPGLVLAKIAREVNSQVTPIHLEKAHIIVEDTKQKVASTFATLNDKIGKAKKGSN